MDIKKILLTMLITTSILLLSTINVLAEGGADMDNTGSSAQDKPVKLDNPLGKTADGKDVTPQTLIGRIINAVLGVVGSIALLMFIYGGFTWMTAAGNQERVTKGKDILVWATIGLIFIFTSYALVKFVFTGLGVG